MNNNVFPSCQYCGYGILHSGICPRIKSIEYFENGMIKKMELFPDQQQVLLDKVNELEQEWSPLNQ